MNVTATDWSDHSATGTYTSDGTTVSINIGFKPLYVRIWDTGTPFGADATSATVTTLEDVNAASNQQSDVSNVITFNNYGFTVGTDANLNASGHTYAWYAVR